MQEQLDPRAVVATLFALAAVAMTLLVALPFTVGFSTFGVIFAGASIVAVDEPATSRTRRVALASGGISLLLGGVALALILSRRFAPVGN